MRPLRKSAETPADAECGPRSEQQLGGTLNRENIARSDATQAAVERAARSTSRGWPLKRSDGFDAVAPGDWRPKWNTAEFAAALSALQRRFASDRGGGLMTTPGQGRHG